MWPLPIGQARCALAEQAHRLPIALETVIGLAQPTCRPQERLKRVEAHVSIQYLDGSGGLARIHQGSRVSMVDEIGVEREGSLEFGDAGVVLTLVNQESSKLSARLWQQGVEVDRRLR